MAWDDEKKAKAVALYEEGEPTPETSIELVKSIAEELGETPNGVRMILSKAGVYVKATASSAGGTKKDAPDKEEKAPRESKADKFKRLTNAIASSGCTPDEAIIEKMTGKAADYFSQLIEGLVKALETDKD